jgi:hypothetical protein
MGLVIKTIRQHPVGFMGVANAGLVVSFLALVAIYKEAKSEGMLEFMDFIKFVTKAI